VACTLDDIAMADANGSDHAHTRNFEDVHKKERALITERAGGTKQKAYAGLALSGGGIRSASFGLGVLQALEKHGVLNRVHYLSTVSGGGYIGSSFTWFKRKRAAGSEALFTPEETSEGEETLFPLGTKGMGVRSERAQVQAQEISEGEALKAQEAEPDNEAFSNAVLGFLRQHGNYLTADRRGVFALVALMVRSTFLSLLVYTLLLTSMFLLGEWLEGLFPATWTTPLEVEVQGRPVSAIVLWMAGALVVLSLLGAVLYAVCSFFLAVGEAELGGMSPFRAYSYRFRWRVRNLGGWLWAFVFGLAILGSVPLAAAYLDNEEWVAGISTLVGTVTGIFTFLKQVSGAASDSSGGTAGGTSGGVSGLLKSLRLPLAACLLLYGLLLVGHALASWATECPLWKAGPQGVELGPFGIALVQLGLALIPLAVGLAIGGMTSLNYIGVTRMYRDRLMELFLPNDEVVNGNRWWDKATEAETFNLWRAADATVRAPYHILNATLNTSDDKDSKFRGRAGDSFILAPLYCGSDATGWRRTGPKDEEERKRIAESKSKKKAQELWMQGGLTLATAMAISGAAVNPNSGVRTKDIMRGRAVSIVMAVLNLRLGYWAHNPGKPPRRRWYPASLIWPGVKQIPRRGIDSKSGYVELSDGGHFENLGLYELIRRRVDVIVVSDASMDPKLSFASLANAVERVRVDFGVGVYFDQMPLSGLLANTAEKGPETDKYHLAERGYAVGTISYPADAGKPEKDGTIIYIKPVLTPGLTADLLGYKDANPAFPHETTADQFFDEEQFEAYRELGYRLTDQMYEQQSERTVTIETLVMRVTT
jgi:hypothetical protein